MHEYIAEILIMLATFATGGTLGVVLAMRHERI